MLSVSNVQKSFGGVQAIKSISFELPDKQILGVLGMNGSGKTTMLNCINGIHRVTSGDIYLDGEKVDQCARHEVFSKGVGRTFQVPKLFHKMNLMENIKVPLLSKNLSDQEIEEVTEVWLRRVNLWHLRYNLAEELSGGQQKLVEIARVMAANPKVVLLDEPFAGVNPSLALLLIDVIKEMPEKYGCSVVLVSHDLTSVYKLSSSILVMHEGEKLAEGDADAIRGNQRVIEAYLGA